MVYRAIGVMSGSSLDGLDIVFAELEEQGGKWQYEIKASGCYPYSPDWVNELKNAITLDARRYQLLHTAYGHYIGKEVNRFIEENDLQFKTGLVSSHGHTTFHMPAERMTAQLGDGAAIAAEVKLPVVTDLRAMDVAVGGQGAPIVPIGEKYLLGDYDYFLNLGGIANVSINGNKDYVAFDICAANRVLNMLSNKIDKEFDKGGEISRTGNINEPLLSTLNELEYYKLPYPKSLANDFGTDLVFPLIEKTGLSIEDSLRTYTEHIALQIKNSIQRAGETHISSVTNHHLLVTGGGALNNFLIERISSILKELNIDVVVPDDQLINFKEALIMALMGVLRWRQEYNVIATVTGATRNTVGGALWMGEDA